MRRFGFAVCALAIACSSDDGGGASADAAATGTVGGTGTTAPATSSVGSTGPGASSGGGPADSGSTDSGGASSSGGLEFCVGVEGSPPLTFADVQPIFMTCTCHFVVPFPEGFAMQDAPGSMLVPSTQVPTLDRVTPGSCDDSYLLLKLHGIHGTVGGLGMPMPLAGEITEENLRLIEEWILGGAMP